MRLSTSILAATTLTTAWGSAVPRQTSGSGRTTSLLTDFPGQGVLPALSDIINLNATNGTFLPIQNIQGDIFVGMKKPKELFYFFSITNPAAFKTALKNNVIPLVTSTATLLSPPSSQPLAFLNIAFSQSGLTALGITDNLGDPQFAAGMFADATNLGDVQSDYESAFRGNSIHGILLIGSDQTTYINNLLSTVTGFFGSSITEKYRLSGAARPGSQAGHEHFGFLDGISQPAISGFATNVLPGQSVIPSGIILANRLGDTALLSRPFSGWTLDGSFLVFRKLKQFVPEFNQYLTANAVQNAAGTLTVQQGAELLGARLLGRWRSGAPIDLSPTQDDPTLGADPTRNNNFDYNHLGKSITTSQSDCPFAAHIRKTRPRGDLFDSNLINQAIRAGIPYGPEVGSDETTTTTQDRGLAFVEYQSVIANGFRFQQIQWSNTANFPPGKNQTVGIEPVIGQVGGGAVRTGLGFDPRDASKSYSYPQFVRSDGGEYFFSPSISALKNKIAA